MTKEALLKASIAEFRDKTNNAIAYKFKRVYTKQGYAYLVIDKARGKKISCAIHIDTIKHESSNKGITPSSSGFLSTRTELALDEVVIYKDFYIFPTQYRDYNETMKQWGYSCNTIPNDLVKALDELTQIYGASCYDKISNLPNWEILPHFDTLIAEDYSEGVVLLKIENSESKSIPKARNKKIKQLKQDDIVFTCINKDRNAVLKLVKDLQDYSLSSANFGIISTPTLIDFDEVFIEASLKSIISQVRVRISYNLETEIDSTDRAISKVFYKIMEVSRDGKSKIEASYSNSQAIAQGVKRLRRLKWQMLILQNRWS